MAPLNLPSEENGRVLPPMIVPSSEEPGRVLPPLSMLTAEGPGKVLPSFEGPDRVLPSVGQSGRVLPPIQGFPVPPYPSFQDLPPLEVDDEGDAEMGSDDDDDDDDDMEFEDPALQVVSRVLDLYSKWYGGGYYVYDPERERLAASVHLANRRADSNYMIWNRALDNQIARTLIPGATFRIGDKSYSIGFGKPPTQILNIGYGSGEWASDIAKRYPAAQVIGVDLFSTDDVRYEGVPENVTYTSAESFDHPFCSFDSDHPGRYSFVAARSVLREVHDLPRFLAQCRDSLVPGEGRLEIHDVGPLTSDDGSLEGTMLEAAQELNYRVLGRDMPDAMPYLRGLLEMAGFVDISIECTRCPVNPNTVRPGVPDAALGERDLGERDLGHLFRRQFDDGFLAEVRGDHLFFCNMAWELSDLEGLYERFRAELEDPSITVYAPVYVVSARRPVYAPYSIILPWHRLHANMPAAGSAA